jgi:hypothetical protein
MWAYGTKRRTAASTNSVAIGGTADMPRNRRARRSDPFDPQRSLAAKFAVTHKCALLSQGSRPPTTCANHVPSGFPIGCLSKLNPPPPARTEAARCPSLLYAFLRLGPWQIRLFAVGLVVPFLYSLHG